MFLLQQTRSDEQLWSYFAQEAACPKAESSKVHKPAQQFQDESGRSFPT